MPWQLSPRCIDAIRAHRAAGGRQHELALMAGLHRVSLSRWLHRTPGRDRPNGPGDQRVRRLAKLLDLEPAECVTFVGEQPDQE